MNLKILPIFLLLALSTALVGQEIELNPEKGWQGRALEVIVSGTNTTFQSATSTCNPLSDANITFKQASATVFSPVAVDIMSDELMELSLQIPANVDNGSYDLVLWDNELGCEFSCLACFNVLDPPFITWLIPIMPRQVHHLQAWFREPIFALIWIYQIVMSQKIMYSWSPWWMVP